MCACRTWGGGGAYIGRDSVCTYGEGGCVCKRDTDDVQAEWKGK